MCSLRCEQIWAGYQAAAQLLVDFTAVVDGALDELDYDRRLGAYKQLQTAQMWGSLGTLPCVGVVQAVVKDLQREGELALRQEAAGALEALYAAAGKQLHAIEETVALA